MFETPTNPQKRKISILHEYLCVVVYILPEFGLHH